MQNERKNYESRWNEMKEKQIIPIKDKLNLTIEEAALYSGISEKVLRNRIAENDYNFK